MKLVHFLDAGYALLVEEYQRLGTDLTTALKQLSEWQAGGPKEEEEVAQSQQPAEASVARQNAQALAELQSMMAGVGNLG